MQQLEATASSPTSPCLGTILLCLVVLALLAVAKRLKKTDIKPLPDTPPDTPPPQLGAGFQKRLSQLAEFKQRVGHLDVPLDSATRSVDTPKGLGGWVYRQRLRKAEARLDTQEEQALSEVGFRWQFDVDELDWDDMSRRLGQYYLLHGNTVVPKKYEADPLLGAWVCACRRKADPLMNGGRTALSLERIAQLDAIGFSWCSHSLASCLYAADRCSVTGSLQSAVVLLS